MTLGESQGQIEEMRGTYVLCKYENTHINVNSSQDLMQINQYLIHHLQSLWCLSYIENKVYLNK